MPEFRTVFPQYSKEFETDLGHLPFFVHIHIPKTGGTSFNELLRRNFGDAFHPHQSRWVNLFPKLNAKQVKIFAERNDGVLATTSHLVSLDLPFDDCRRPIVAIALIRDPVARFLSLYFFLRFKPGEHLIQKDLDLDAYIDHMATRFRRGLRDGHMAYLTAENGETEFDRVRTLAEAGRLHLIPTEALGAGMARLQTAYPRHFRDITLERENPSIRDQEVTEAHRAAIREICCPWCYRLLELARKTVAMPPVTCDQAGTVS